MYQSFWIQYSHSIIDFKLFQVADFCYGIGDSNVGTCNHVIGISPFISSKKSQVEYRIIGGAHPELKAMNFSQENMDWCCGKELSFDKITCGFAFVPGGIECLKCSMINQDTIWYQRLLCA